MPNILYGEGAQSVYHTPRGALFRPVAVSGTYEILDLRESETSDTRVVQAAGAATADSATETLTVAAGPATGDAHSIPVADASDFAVGHTYQITDPDGLTEPLVVAGVDTGATERLLTLTPLINDYAIGSVVAGVELSGSVPAALLDEDDNLGNGAGPYAVIWRYTIAGVDYVVPEPLFLRRYSAQPPLTIADVLAGDPNLASMIRDRVNLQAALVLATEDAYADLANAHRDATLYIDPLNLRRMVRSKTIAYAYEWIREETWADRWHQRYTQTLSQTVHGRREAGSITIDNKADTAPAGTSTERRGFLAES